jgi:hypothetical protein
LAEAVKKSSSKEGAGIAQSAWLATGWTTERPELESR